MVLREVAASPRMQTAAVRSGALIGVLWLLTGCGASGPASPTLRTDVTPALAPVPPTAQPSAPYRAFAFDHHLSSSVSESTKRSRSDRSNNGAFALDCP